MKTKIVIALLVGLITSTAGAQFQLDTKAIDQVFSKWDKPDSPGCTVAILKDGNIVYAKGFGMANLDYLVPNQPNTVFRIASTSKQITAALMALLAQEGVLSLDDDIRKWIPEIPDYGKTITIKDLIYHVSGLRDYTSIMYLNDTLDDHCSNEEALAIISRQKGVNFDPGTRFSYCNTGYFLLSVICERATGQTIRESAEDYIFEPLKMTHTHFQDDYREVIPNRAIGYERDDDRDWKISTTRMEMCGDGGIFTTVEDYALWDENFYTGQVGGPNFLKTIQTPGGMNAGQPQGYAFGLDINEHRGLPVVSHGGAWVGYRAEMIRFPEQHFSVICFSNAANCSPTKLCYQVADICLEDIYPKEEAKEPQAQEARSDEDREGEKRKQNKNVDLTPKQLSHCLGRYYSEELGILCSIEVNDSKLALRVIGDLHDLLAISPDRFRGAFNTQITFQKHEGEITGFLLDQDGLRGIQFERIKPHSSR